MSKENKLRPCPFCGNKNVAVVIIPTFNATIAVECPECRVRGPEYSFEQGNKLHILWWNTRYIEHTE